MGQIGLVFLLCISALAQSADSKVTVSGAVVNGLTGEPLADVVVDVHLPASQYLSVSSGKSGEFQFSAPAKSEFSLYARKASFEVSRIVVPMEHEAPRNVTVRLMPLGAIEGFVRDTGGKPLAGFQVEAATVESSMGVRRWHLSRSARTDARGYYRIADLNPAEYWVRALGWSGGPTMQYSVEPPAALMRLRDAVWPEYLGAARTLDAARPTAVVYGARVNADFQVEVRAAVRVSGVVTGLDGRQPYFWMIPPGRDEKRFQLQASYYDRSGRFELSGVPSEMTFVLHVENLASNSGVGEPFLRQIQTTIAVGTKDLDGLVLDMNQANPMFSVKSGGSAAARQQQPGYCSATLYPIYAMQWADSLLEVPAYLRVPPGTSPTDARCREEMVSIRMGGQE